MRWLVLILVLAGCWESSSVPKQVREGDNRASVYIYPDAKNDKQDYVKVTGSEDARLLYDLVNTAVYVYSDRNLWELTLEKVNFTCKPKSSPMYLLNKKMIVEAGESARLCSLGKKVIGVEFKNGLKREVRLRK